MDKNGHSQVTVMVRRHLVISSTLSPPDCHLKPGSWLLSREYPHQCGVFVLIGPMMRLARYFGTSAAVWLRLQVRYDLEVAEKTMRERINREVKVFH